MLAKLDFCEKELLRKKLNFLKSIRSLEFTLGRNFRSVFQVSDKSLKHFVLFPKLCVYLGSFSFEGGFSYQSGTSSGISLNLKTINDRKIVNLFFNSYLTERHIDSYYIFYEIFVVSLFYLLWKNDLRLIEGIYLSKNELTEHLSFKTELGSIYSVLADFSTSLRLRNILLESKLNLDVIYDILSESYI